MKFPPHKCGLYLEHNANRDLHESVAEYLDLNDRFQFRDDASRQACIDSGELWTLQWYPETPIGFHAVAAPTLIELLELANQEECEDG